MLSQVQELPQTEQELWSMLPPLAWTPRRRELIVAVREARDRLDRVRTEAQRDLAAADVELTTAVVEAWLGGASWRTIGVLLGTSRQAAAQRFGAAVRQALEVSGDS
jgi:hypothetical protein